MSRKTIKVPTCRITFQILGTVVIYAALAKIPEEDIDDLDLPVDSTLVAQSNDDDYIDPEMTYTGNYVDEEPKTSYRQSRETQRRQALMKKRKKALALIKEIVFRFVYIMLLVIIGFEARGLDSNLYKSQLAPLFSINGVSFVQVCTTITIITFKKYIIKK